MASTRSEWERHRAGETPVSQQTAPVVWGTPGAESFQNRTAGWPDRDFSRMEATDSRCEAPDCEVEACEQGKAGIPPIPRKPEHNPQTTNPAMKRPSLHKKSILTLLAMLCASLAGAATFTVTNTNDSGTGSLRAAITSANAAPGPHTIAITAAGIIDLVTPLPALTQDMTIGGPGAFYLTVQKAASASFYPKAIFEAGFGTVTTLSGMTISGNDDKGVENSATLIIQDCVIRDNKAVPGSSQGGGIFNHASGDLTLLRSTVAFNTTTDKGSGLYTQGHVKVLDSTITGNSVFRQGDVSGEFLTFKQAGDTSKFGDPHPPFAGDQDALNYYSVVDPQKLRTTLGDWWKANGFNKTDGSAPSATKVAYLNHNDLGFGRDMHMVQNGSVVSSWVANYSLTAPFPDQNPLSADAALAEEPSQSIATVCMEYSAVEGASDNRPFVKFFVYAGVGPTAARIDSADLDGRGQKFVPQLCTVCHGALSPLEPRQRLVI